MRWLTWREKFVRPDLLLQHDSEAGQVVAAQLENESKV